MLRAFWRLGPKRIAAVRPRRGAREDTLTKDDNKYELMDEKSK